MLSEWGIAPSGSRPDPGSRANLIDQDRLVDFPQSPKSLLFSGFLNVREKLDAVNALRKLQLTKACEGSMKEWIHREVATEKVAMFVRAMIRVATYNDENDRLDAMAAIRQFQAAANGGVIYLDGGWQSMIDLMRNYALKLGVQIELNANADTGSILAVPPAQAEKLTGVRLPATRPVRMACLDLALESLPPNASLFALGLDQPIYFSVHSQWAKIAPEGKVVVHIGKYLGSGNGTRAELEAAADIAMPGWRDRVVTDRFLPDMTVAHSAPWIDAPRPTVDAIEGVRLAGDWVACEGMLADACFASAEMAAA
jgi:phytoene dehydrogenase-like protein